MRCLRVFVLFCTLVTLCAGQKRYTLPLTAAVPKAPDSRLYPVASWHVFLTRFVLDYAVEKLNSIATFLPNHQITLDYIETEEDDAITAFRATTLLQSRDTAAIIGGTDSPSTQTLGALSGVYPVPVIASGATASDLEDKASYPLLTRVVPSDRVRAVAILDLLRQYRWRDIGLLSSNDEYGREFAQAFRQGIRNVQATSAVGTGGEYNHVFKLLVDKEFDPMNAQQMRTTVIQMEKSRVRVFMVAARTDAILQLLNVLSGDHSFTFIAVDLVDPASVGNLTPVDRIRFASLMNGMLSVNLAVDEDNPIANDIRSTCQARQPAVCVGGGFSTQFYSFDAVEAMARAFQTLNNTDVINTSPFQLDSNGVRVIVDDVVPALKGSSYVKSVRGLSTLYPAPQLVRDQIIDSQFKGATGPVRFTADGDRIAVYDVLNVVDSKFVKIGRWEQLYSNDMLAKSTIEKIGADAASATMSMPDDGTVVGNLTLTEAARFKGGSTVIPLDADLLELNLQLLTPLTGPLGDTGKIVSAMTQVAIDDLNSRENFMEGYSLTVDTIDTKADRSWGGPLLVDTLRRKKVHGIIGGLTDSVTTMGARIAGQFNVPMISYGATSSVLSDLKTYPTFSRVVASNNAFLLTILDFWKMFDWWSLTIIADVEHEDARRFLERQCNNRHAEFLDIPRDRDCIMYATFELRPGDEEQDKHIMTRIETTSAVGTVLLLTTANFVYFLDLMEKNGHLRERKFNFFVVEFERDEVLGRLPREDRQLAMARANGGVVVTPISFRRNVTDVVARCSSRTNTLCAQFLDSQDIDVGLRVYDAIVLYALAVDALLKVGQPLSPSNIVQSIGRQRFTGFTGFVELDEHRTRLQRADILNIIFQQPFFIGVWEQKTRRVELVKAIEWANYTTVVPDGPNRIVKGVVSHFRQYCVTAGVVGILANLALHLWTAMHRNSPAVRTSNEAYCHTVLLGNLLGFIALLFYGGLNETSNEMCQLTAVTIVMSYAILLPALYARFHCLRHMDTIAPDNRMPTPFFLWPTAGVVVYCLSVLVLIYTIDPPVAVYKVRPVYRAHFVCRMDTYLWLMLAIPGFIAMAFVFVKSHQINWEHVWNYEEERKTYWCLAWMSGGVFGTLLYNLVIDIPDFNFGVTAFWVWFENITIMFSIFIDKIVHISHYPLLPEKIPEDKKKGIEEGASPERPGVSPYMGHVQGIVTPGMYGKDELRQVIGNTGNSLYIPVRPVTVHENVYDESSEDDGITKGGIVRLKTSRKKKKKSREKEKKSSSKKKKTSRKRSSKDKNKKRDDEDEGKKSSKKKATDKDKKRSKKKDKKKSKSEKDEEKEEKREGNSEGNDASEEAPPPGTVAPKRRRSSLLDFAKSIFGKKKASEGKDGKDAMPAISEENDDEKGKDSSGKEGGAGKADAKESTSKSEGNETEAADVRDSLLKHSGVDVGEEDRANKVLAQNESKANSPALKSAMKSSKRGSAAESESLLAGPRMSHAERVAAYHADHAKTKDKLKTKGEKRDKEREGNSQSGRKKGSEHGERRRSKSREPLLEGKKGRDHDHRGRSKERSQSALKRSSSAVRDDRHRSRDRHAPRSASVAKHRRGSSVERGRSGERGRGRSRSRSMDRGGSGRREREREVNAPRSASVIRSDRGRSRDRGGDRERSRERRSMSAVRSADRPMFPGAPSPARPARDPYHQAGRGVVPPFSQVPPGSAQAAIRLKSPVNGHAHKNGNGVGSSGRSNGTPREHDSPTRRLQKIL